MADAAARLRRHRERQKAGRLCVTVEIDEVALAVALIDAKLLPPELENDRAAIKRALEQAIDTWIKLSETRYDAGM
jgi:hypothetical protein